MMEPTQPTELASADRQRSEMHLRFGEVVDIKTSIDVSSSGLLAITALVSGVLLSTAILVRSAVRESRRFPGWPR